MRCDDLKLYGSVHTLDFFIVYTGYISFKVTVCVCVLQSAAMEETVIWEQHTVTLHRVSARTSSVKPS